MQLFCFICHPIWGPRERRYLLSLEVVLDPFLKLWAYWVSKDSTCSPKMWGFAYTRMLLLVYQSSWCGFDSCALACHLAEPLLVACPLLSLGLPAHPCLPDRGGRGRQVPLLCCNCPSCACFLMLRPKMRSGKASCALETVWEDKHKYEEAERRFHEHEATRAAAAATAATASVQQLLAKVPAVNGPSQEDLEDTDEAEAPHTSSRSDPRKSHECKKPLQKKRKRSPKSWLGQADLALVGLSADHVWLDKPLFDQAESSYRQRLADVAAQAAQPPALAPRGPCAHGSHVACHHVIWGIWVNKPCFDQAERAFVEWSQALLLGVEGSQRQGTPDTGQPAVSPDLALACQPCPPANGQPPLGSLQALVREVWLEKPRYDAAERGFYEALFDGHPPGKVRLQERASQAEGARRGRRDRRIRNAVGNKRAGSKRADGEAPSALPYWYFLHKDAEAPWLSKPTYDSAECRHHAAEALRIAWRLEAASLAHRPTPRSGPSMSSLRPK